MSQLSVNAIRFLGIDAIEKAKSGHPRNGTVIIGSNTFKIKPFNATKRRIENKLLFKQSNIPGIRTIMKIPIDHV